MISDLEKGETSRQNTRGHRNGARARRLAQCIFEMITNGANLTGFTELIGTVRQLVAGVHKRYPQQTDDNQPLENRILRTEIARADDHSTWEANLVELTSKLITDCSL